MLRYDPENQIGYVNVPGPLAAALDLEAGELVQWQLLTRNDLRLLRLGPAKSSKTKRRNR